MMSQSNEFRARAMKFEKSAAGKALKPHVSALADMLDQIGAKRTAVNGNAKLSDVGRRDELAQFAPTLAATIAKARGAASAAKASMNARSKELLPKSAKDDVAAAIRGMEMRALLRTLSPVETLKFASSDPSVMAAILESSAPLSGLSTEQHQAVLKMHLDKNCASQMAAIRDDEQPAELLDAAITAAAKSLGEAAGILPAQFDAWLVQHAPKEVAKIAAETAAVEIDAKALTERVLLLPWEAQTKIRDEMYNRRIEEIKAS